MRSLSIHMRTTTPGCRRLVDPHQFRHHVRGRACRKILNQFRLLSLAQSALFDAALDDTSLRYPGQPHSFFSTSPRFRGWRFMSD